MDVVSTAADLLGVTPAALDAALGRGETIASLARECGLDEHDVVEAVVEAEASDVAVLAMIGGFGQSDIDQFVAEISAYVRTFVVSGPEVADAALDGQPLIPA